MSADIEDAERRLGRAVLALDDMVREYRRERRDQGAPEAHVMFGVHRGDRQKVFDEVNDAVKALRKLQG